nr:DUF1330 domain-containing protein [Hyphomonas sp. Mor2]
MSVFVLAQLSFKDEARYRSYQASFPDVFAQSGGEVIIADENPELLEGDWYGDKVVLLRFSGRNVAQRFLQSPAYQEISEHRKAGADTISLMLHGL